MATLVPKRSPSSPLGSTKRTVSFHGPNVSALVCSRSKGSKSTHAIGTHGRRHSACSSVLSAKLHPSKPLEAWALLSERARRAMTRW